MERGNLILTRKVGEWVRLETTDGHIWLCVTEIRSGSGAVRLMFDAPLTVSIKRDNILPIGERHE